MVVVSHCPNQSLSENINTPRVPVIDLSCADRSSISKLVVEACEKLGFFKVINHGVPDDVVTRIEEESLRFFSRPGLEKQRGGTPNPFGYGFKNIGFNGDVGEVEYLILDGSGESSSSNHQVSECISPDNPANFSNALSGYVRAVRGLACEILDLISLALSLTAATSSSQDSSPSLGGMIRASGNDSVLRINFYPCSAAGGEATQTEDGESAVGLGLGLGFGEHSDPQVLTVLRSNDVRGLQVWVREEGEGEGWWTAVPPDPNAFWVNVGDLLQAMTNGRFQTLRHRVVLTTSQKPRMSVAFFGAPPLDTIIIPRPPPHHHHQQQQQQHQLLLYRPFTWSEYKKAAFSLKLSDSRLHLFLSSQDDEK